MNKWGLDAIKKTVTRKRPVHRHFSTRQITPVIGAEITGIDLSRELDDEAIAEIREALLEYHVLVFRDQDLTREQEKAFGRRFGTLRSLPVEDIDGDDPEIVLIQASRQSKFVAGESWHTDGTAAAEPAFAQILYLKEIPEIGCGGDTMFANMHMAYEMLSPAMKVFLDGLTAIHDGAVPWRGYDAPPNLPKTEHPVVALHSETGRKMLFVNPGFTTHIPQLAPEESQAVLNMLFALVDQEHALSCRISWQPGTMVFWDNRCTQHRAIWDYFPCNRYGERVTLLGSPILSPQRATATG